MKQYCLLYFLCKNISGTYAASWEQKPAADSSYFDFFWFMRVLDLDRPRTKRVKYDRTLSAGVEISGLKGHWGELQCGGLRPLGEGLLGNRGSWTACRSALGGDGVDGHHYW